MSGTQKSKGALGRYVGKLCDWFDARDASPTGSLSAASEAQFLEEAESVRRLLTDAEVELCDRLIDRVRKGYAQAQRKRPLRIAEVKTESPFGFRSKRSWPELFEIAQSCGDWIAVHTDVRWGGSMALVEEARRRTGKPIVAKGIHPTDREILQAVEAGADYVLVVGRIPSVHRERCLIEPWTMAELRQLAKLKVRAVWNARDLRTGGWKKESWAEARIAFAGWLCQASGVQLVTEVQPDAQAVLVGTHLPEFARSAER